MKTEQIEQILANAPDGATHYQSTTYLRYDGKSWVWWSKEEVKWRFVKDSSLGWAQCLGGYHGSLSDLREILALRQRVRELEDDHEKAYERRLAKHRQLKPCYECGTPVHELSPRSRCCMCEYNRAIFNEEENNQLRGQDYE